MSKQRKITDVRVDTYDRDDFRSVWVHVFWDGKPNILSNGEEVRNRFYTAIDRWQPEKFDRLLKRGRQMESILLNQITEENNE